ncbi:MAG: FAD-dependent monooxygenase [Candidatus Hydrogenedentes bacterium]|nr:FAD-dependent monooxygenase [Candidatus Hydrogenedentota bacterium]
MSIAATLTLRETGTIDWDAIVVGAGPSGAIAARGLALTGRKVLLVDKARFPRWKVCGCCLNLRALSVFDEAGLGSLVRERGGVPLHRIEVASMGGRCQLPLPGGVTLSREALDAALVEAAIQAGAQFLPQTSASLEGVAADYRTARLRSGDEAVTAQARLVVVASGLGSKLLTDSEEFATTPTPGSRIGAGAIAPVAPSGYESGTIYMACAKAGYVGFTMIEGGRLDVAAALNADAVRTNGGLARVASRVLEEAGFREMTDLDSLDWRGTPALTRHTARISAHRLLLVGDAAGYVEPFTGEGMAWALSGGAELARIASRILPQWHSAIEDEWRLCYRRMVTQRQLVCKALSALLRHPRLTATIVRALAVAPGLARPLIRQLNAEVTRATRSSA